MAGALKDCGFDDDGLWFRYRAAAVILRGDHVLVAANDEAPYFYSVGGGVRHGETAAEAAAREVWEETGVRMSVSRLLFIHENFFTDDHPSLVGRQCHEVAFYFLMDYDGVSPIHGADAPDARAEERVEWVRIDDIGTTVRVYPTFFRTHLRDLPDAPRMVVTREEEQI